jgi:hypothetical protein
MFNLNLKIMKKTNFLVVVASIATLGFFSTSCKKDASVAPTITLSANCVKDAATISLGDSITIEFTVTADNKLKTVEIIDDSSKTVKSFTDVTAALYTYKFAPKSVGSKKYNINVTDSKDLKATSTLSITVEALSYNAYTTTLLYAPTADKTSKTFFSSTTGTTYDVTGFSSNSATIDFGYFYGASNHATLASASDYLTTAYDIATLYPSATKNVTTFAKATVTYASITKSADIASAYTTGTLATDGSNPAGGATRVKLLAAGNVIAFKTAAGKYGVANVVATSGTDAAGGSITLDVKVQK